MSAVVWPDGSNTIPYVTAEYGWYDPFGTGPRMHNGIDLIGWSTIIAPASGVVSFAGYNGGAGNEVRIRADNGDVYRLLHNRELWVVTGQRVAQGQGVAVMGTTGSSTGVHCHYETHPGGGAAINPRDYMAAINRGDDDMNADQDARLRNIEALLAGTGPSLQDPNWRAGQGSVLNHLQNLTGFVWAGGTSTADPEFFGAPGTIYHLVKSNVHRVVDGKPLSIPQIQDNADTNTFVRAILDIVRDLSARPVVEFTDEQIATLASGIASALETAGIGGASKGEVEDVITGALASLVLVSRSTPNG